MHPQPPARRPIPQRVLLLLFVLSGAAGLIYEVVWARQLVLVFGNTSQAVSTILTGFFGGLALGGWAGGRLADRVARPLRLYGLLELVLVGVVLLTPVTFPLIGQAYRDLYPSLAAAPFALGLVRFALSILALAPATLLMGATLPTLTRYLGRDGGDMAGSFRRLYTANTVGAIVGTLLAGLVLIEILGLAGALAVGAACSALAGIVALLLDWAAGLQITAPTPRTSPAPTPSGMPASIDRRRLALSLGFISGLTSLGYQVTWNRLVGAGTGSSTYVFTIILGLFLLGIALGAGLLGPLRQKVRSTPVLIGTAQLVTAVLVILGALTLSSPQSPLVGGESDFVLRLVWFAAQVVFIVLPATIAMGITFPATASLLGESQDAEGASSGSLLAVNTAGSLVATFALPFLVMPLIGSPATLACLAIVNAVVGASLLVGERRLSLGLRRVSGLAGAAIALLVALAMASGLAFTSPTVKLISSLGGEVYATAEDDVATTVAGQVFGSPQVWVAGTSMTALTVDTKFMPLLPLAMRPAATRGLVIAFGMGTAFRTSLRAGIETDVVELVPSVPGMFHWFYPDAAAVLANPQGRVIVADGRNHVELTASTYDFVVVDPPPPIESSGVSVISSLEFYKAAKARLVANGVMVQWVPFGQTLDELLAHIRTYAHVFANVRVVAGAGGAGVYLLGSDGPVDLSALAIETVLARPGVLADVNEAPDAHGRTAAAWGETLMGLTWAAGDQLRTAVGDGPLVTDDRPLPEYFLLRRLAQPSAPPASLVELRRLLK